MSGSSSSASAETRVAAALAIAAAGQSDGTHHKAWVIDQMVRALTGEHYDQWIVERRRGEEGPETFE